MRDAQSTWHLAGGRALTLSSIVKWGVWPFIGSVSAALLTRVDWVSGTGLSAFWLLLPVTGAFVFGLAFTLIVVLRFNWLPGLRLKEEAVVDHWLVRIGFETPTLPPPRPDDGTCRFTLVGHHFFRKGGRALMTAFDRLRRTHPEARLTIVSHVDPATLGVTLDGVTLIPELPREAIWVSAMME